MTFVVGVLCEDGAVIAADRQVSHGALGQTTVGYPGNKVFQHEDMIYAISGPVSLAQQVGHFLISNWSICKTSDYFNVVPQLQQGARSILIPALQTAQQAGQALGQVALMEGVSGGLLAVPFKDGLKLVEINHQGRFEFMTRDTAFICVGSGKANADPFVRFLWSVFWADRLPNVEEGVLTAYWTVKAAIQAQSFGVGYGVDVLYLKKTESGYSATRLGDTDFLEHDEFIDNAREVLRQTRVKMSPLPKGNHSKKVGQGEHKEEVQEDAIPEPLEPTCTPAEPEPSAAR